MRVQVLGPLRVWNGLDWVPVRAAQQRTVLATLLTEPRRLITTDRLVAELWPDDAPTEAGSTVRGYVMRLRRLLGDAARCPLVTGEGGYRLEIADEAYDAWEFDQLATTGYQAIARGDLEKAEAHLSEALAIWRGAPFADVPATPAVTAAAARLDQARLAALEERFGVLLRLRRDREVLAETTRLVDEHPLRERLWAHHMRALYRSGLRGQALEAYQRARAVLVDQLGLEPGPKLRNLQKAILADDPALADPTQPVATTVAPAQLPGPAAGFVGRERQMDALDLFTADDLGASEAVQIAMIVGPAGVGKTALAVHWAQRTRNRFPDGQLYVNLRGHSAGVPMPPVEALGRLLIALGMPAEQIPIDVEQAATGYRSMLAGRRVLILLDDARDAAQVRPLLPGAAGCLVLVTSRTQLRGLTARDGARRLDVGLLSHDEAYALLVAMLGRQRVQAEPAAAAELCRLCAHLPLALRIAAANLSARSLMRTSRYVEWLAADRFGALEVDGDPHTAVRRAFDHSYATLPAQASRLFRLLGLAPGPDVSVEAASALACLADARTARLLDQLANTCLLEEHRPNRYALHDLIRQYAVDRATAEETEPDRQAARQRLFAFYRWTANSAATRLYPHSLRLPQPADDSVQPMRFDTDQQAANWLDAEYAGLAAAVPAAIRDGSHPAAWLLADAIRQYSWHAGHTAEWVAIGLVALDAATSAGDLRAQAAIHLGLGNALAQRSEYTKASRHLTEVLSLSQQAGWQEAHLRALGNLAALRRETGRLPEAERLLRQVLTLAEQTGPDIVIANTLFNLGEVSRELGRLDQAIDSHRRALKIFAQIGGDIGAAAAQCGLGECHHALGHLHEAIEHLAHALRMDEAAGNTSGLPYTRTCLAAALCDAGRHDEALRQAESALAEAAGGGDPRAQSIALNVLGTVHAVRQHLNDALDAHQRAADLAQANDDHEPAIIARIGLAVVYTRLAKPDTAIEHATVGLAVARQIGHRIPEGNALTALAGAHLRLGHHTEAVNLAEQALAIHTQTGHRIGEARTHLVIEHACSALGRHHQAQAHNDRARALRGQIGPPLAF